MDTNDLIQYYVNLLIVQYYNQPNAQGVVAAVVALALADQIADQILNAFDLDTAFGAQLDIIGKYVGVPRIISGLDMGKTYFSWPNSGDAHPENYKGMSLYGSSSSAFWLYYGDENTAYSLTDDDMRKLIKLKIRKHLSDHSMKDIDSIMNDFFGSEVIVTDNGDMSMTYAFTPGTDTFPKLATFTDSLPRPAGVLINISGI